MGTRFDQMGTFPSSDGTRVALQKSPKTLKLGPQNRCYFRFPLTLPGSFRSSSRWEHHFPMWKWHNMAPWHHRSRSLPHLGQITVLKVGWVDMRTAQNSQNIVFFSAQLKTFGITIVYNCLHPKILTSRNILTFCWWTEWRFFYGFSNDSPPRQSWSRHLESCHK